MKSNIKKVFDEIKLSDKQNSEIESFLFARLSKNQEENFVMNKSTSTIRKPRALMIVAVIIASLGLMGFAFGSPIIELLGGGTYTQEQDYISMSLGFEAEPVKISDGRVLFVLNNENIDITNEVSKTKYYQYEVISQEGIRHIIVVGGGADDIGYGEYIWDKNGDFLGNNANYNVDDAPEGYRPEWLKNADKDLLNR